MPESRNRHPCTVHLCSSNYKTHFRPWAACGPRKGISEWAGCLLSWAEPGRDQLGFFWFRGGGVVNCFVAPRHSGPAGRRGRMKKKSTVSRRVCGVSAAAREPSRHAQGLAGSVLSKFKGGCHRGVFTRLLLSLGKISGGTSRCRCSWNAGPHVPRQECRPSCCLLHFGAHRKLRRRSD